ncbi:MAG: translation factor GTPase family protein [Chloroflexota bacterium]
MKETIKNIGILAHVDAGKTTLTEQLLYQTGAIRSVGRVDHGNTQTDTMDLERERGISIMSMPTSYTYKGQKINIVDTPGHVDFVAEVERSMLVLDGAILVISAKEGVQSHTKLLFNALKRMEVPTLLFINKIDRMGVEIDGVLTEIRRQLSPNICVLQTVRSEGSREAVPHPTVLEPDDDLIEMLSVADEMLMLDYLEGETISGERLYDTLKLAVAQRVAYPVLFGSALNGIGLHEMLDEINELLPQFEQIASSDANNSDPSGIVFKVARTNIKTGRVCMVKVTAGEVLNRGFIGTHKVTGVSRWCHGRVEPVKRLQAGDIGMVTGMHHLHVGDTFGQGIDHKGFSLGKPTLKVKMEVEHPPQRRELLEALTVMADNDPYLSYELNEFNDDIYITLFGYIQMEIVEETLKRDYGIAVQMGEPMTIYMETPVTMAESTIPMYDAGLPFHAGASLRVEPLPRGSGIEYGLDLNTQGLKQPFLNGIEDGVHAYLDQGLYGWELTDMKISLIGFEVNSVEGTPKDFRDMVPLVLFDALKTAETKQLWPISDYQLSIPTTLMGRAMSDLKWMQATFDEPLIEGDTCTIVGVIPVDLCHNYELTVHQYTSGRGHFERKVIGYEDAPADMYKERPRFKVDPSNRGEYLMGIVRAT